MPWNGHSWKPRERWDDESAYGAEYERPADSAFEDSGQAELVAADPEDE